MFIDINKISILNLTHKFGALTNLLSDIMIEIANSDKFSIPAWREIYEVVGAMHDLAAIAVIAKPEETYELASAIHVTGRVLNQRYLDLKQELESAGADRTAAEG